LFIKLEEEELDATPVDAVLRLKLSPSLSPSREVVVDATDLNATDLNATELDVTAVLTDAGE
jgi:hypothetical protein